MLTGDEQIGPEDSLQNDTAQPLNTRDEQSGQQPPQQSAAQVSGGELHAADAGGDVPAGAQSGSPAEPVPSAEPGSRPRRRILIGSQRDPAAYRRRQRDWVPVVKPDYEAPQSPSEGEASPQPSTPRPRGTRQAGARESGPKSRKRPRKKPGAKRARGATAQGRAAQAAQPAGSLEEATPEVRPQAVGEASTATSLPPPQQPPVVADEPEATPTAALPGEVEPALLSAAMAGELIEGVADGLAGAPAVGVGPPLPLPNLREQLPAELESEYERALGDTPLEELIGSEGADAAPLLPESRQKGCIVAVGREYVFVDLGRREQGRLGLRQFENPPQVGSTIEVVVERFNEDDGLYELAVPETAVAVDDWGDLAEGMLVEARVTGHNAGGLECEVNGIRGFIPHSQIALYRVEGLEQFVGQRFTCMVSEANHARRNLVLSRRAVLEREQQAARQRLLDSLEPGQVREGVVRRVTDFGAFVDLGGVDGLVHVSRLAWHRVEDPHEVLQEGQQIKVKVEKVDRATGRIGLAYRKMVENPWHRAAEKYPPNSVVPGRVTRLMEFGAFVELEPGVEGLVHISELASRRVWRASDVVSEGQAVEVLVLSVDAEAQRISLSMKALEPEPLTPQAAEDEPGAEQSAPKRTRPKKRKPDRPLAGGLGRPPGGERFGLKW